MSANESADQELTRSTTMLVIVAGRACQRRLETALAEHGLTLRHLGALGHLARSPELSYSDLARRSQVTVQSMHATIATLVELGAIEIHDTQRGKAAQLRLTDHGHRLLEEAKRIVDDLDATCDTGELDPDQFRSALARLVQDASQAG